MPADWMINAGDTQPSYQDRLSYSDGSLPPLHGATVVLRLRSLADAAAIELPVTVTDPNGGLVTYTPLAGDIDTPGNYLADWFVTFDPTSGLGQQKFPTEGWNWVFVKPNLATMSKQIVDLAKVKKYLKIEGDDRTRDADLLELIEDITPLVEATVGPLVPKKYEEWFDGGSNVITLSYDPTEGFGSNPYLKLIAASEFRGPIEYPLALIASPVFGSIYSTMLVPHLATITRRTAGGRTLAFMPGRESTHVWYEAGQDPIPGPVQRAAMEYVRTVYRWPQQTGLGSMAPADRMEAGAALQVELSRLVRMWLRPLQRYPSIG